MDGGIGSGGVIGEVGVKRSLEQSPEVEKYQKVTISNDLPTAEHKAVMESLHNSIALRNKWINYLPPVSSVSTTSDEASSPKYDVFGQAIPTTQLPVTCKMVDGVGVVSGGGDVTAYAVPTFAEFANDYLKVSA
jgi:hypothetical protein